MNNNFWGQKTSQFSEILLIVFIVLKLTKVITWSWWWVLAPFWIPLSIAIVILLIYYIRSKLD